MTLDTSCSSARSSSQIDRIVDDYLVELRAGNAPSYSDFAGRYPTHASELREILPAIEFAERLNPQHALPSVAMPTVDSQVGPFRLIREIGRGGMGVVYEATYADTSQAFAIKLMHGRLANSKVLKARFKREAEAASQLHHPNIVPTKYFGSDDTNNYLVMRLVDGLSLDRLVKRGETTDLEMRDLFENIISDFKKIAELGTQACSALAHAHDQGMVHRDIKPANLLLDRRGCVWVTDFGLAKVNEDDQGLSRSGELLGTPRFMAPEQIFGSADARSDIYSLGLSLYELAVFSLGEEEKWHTLVKKNHCILEPPDLWELCPAIDKSFARVVMKACAHQPAQRYQSAREFEFALNEYRYSGNGDRRQNERVSLHKRIRSLSVGLGLTAMAFLLMIDHNKTMPIPVLEIKQTKSNAPSPHNYIPPDSKCITFADADSNFMNVWVSVCSIEDDVEEYLENGKLIMYLDSTDLEMTWDEVDQLVGLRFAGVDLPRNAIIESAKLCFWAERTERIQTDLNIFGIDEANVSKFIPLAGDLSRRKRTSQHVGWTVPPWTRGEPYESVGIEPIVQHLVSAEQWNPGQAMAFIISGTGQRVATAYDGNIHFGPMLKIKYKLSPDPK